MRISKLVLVAALLVSLPSLAWAGEGKAHNGKDGNVGKHAPENGHGGAKGTNDKGKSGVGGSKGTNRRGRRPDTTEADEGGAKAKRRGCGRRRGGAISSIGVSWTIINSLFSYNRAVGHGANPAQPGTPGGGSGGAIHNDGNTMTLTLLGSRIEHNEVNAHGSALFFVTNDHTGNIVIDRSVIRNNLGGSSYPVHPAISMHADTGIEVTDRTIE